MLIDHDENNLFKLIPLMINYLYFRAPSSWIDAPWAFTPSPASGDS